MATYRLIYNTQISVVAQIDIPDDEVDVDTFDDDEVDTRARGAVEDFLQSMTRQIHGDVKVWADATIDGVGADEITRIDTEEG